MSNKPLRKHDDETESAPRRPLGLWIGGALILFGVLAVVNGIVGLTDNKQRLLAPKAALTVEIADSPEERTKGLSMRDSLAEKSGMLFIFDSGKANCFWMKDTYIPLDMVWLNDDKEVIYVHENAEPESIQNICPDNPGTYVLEVNAGKASEFGLTPGEKVRF